MEWEFKSNGCYVIADSLLASTSLVFSFQTCKSAFSANIFCSGSKQKKSTKDEHVGKVELLYRHPELSSMCTFDTL